MIKKKKKCSHFFSPFNHAGDTIKHLLVLDVPDAVQALGPQRERESPGFCSAGSRDGRHLGYANGMTRASELPCGKANRAEKQGGDPRRDDPLGADRRWPLLRR